MRRAGIIIFVIGILITVFTGLNYVTKEIVMESGELTVTRDANHAFSWSPLIGVLTMVVGGVIFGAGFRQKNKEVKA